MDRIRDGRRGGVSVGGGPPPPPRRRLRSNGGGGGGGGAGPRDSPRSERRRGDRLMLNGGGGGAGRDDGDDTSDESLVDDDDDAEEELAPRYQQQRRSPSTAPPPPSPPQPGGGHHHSSSSSGGGGYHNHHHHHGQQLQRKGGGSNPKSPIVVKAVDEMIGVPVPRKARSASTKRSSHEWPVPGGGTSGGSTGAGEGSQIQRPSSRPISPASASTTAPVRKKLKPLGGGGGSSGGSGPTPKQRPSPSPSPAPSTAPPQPPAPKISKSPSFIQEEIEVAEVLFGLTRQFPCPPPKQESNHKLEPRDAPEAKSGNSSPAPSSSGVRPSDSTSLSTIAPKRKRPRLVKYDEDSRPASPAKPELAEPSSRPEAPPVARSEAKASTSAAAESGASAAPAAAAAQLETSREPDKTEEHGRSRDSELRPSESDRRDHRLESLAEPPAPAPSVKPDAEATPVASEARNGEATATTKIELASDGSRQEKFCIDLMAPPPGKLSPDRDGSSDLDADKKGLDSQMDMLGRGILEKKDGDRTRRGLDIDLEDHKVQRIPADELAPKKLTLQLDLEKPSLGDEKSPSELRQPQPPPQQQQQQKPSKSEIKHEKSAMPAVTPPMPIPVGGWLGSFPPFGYLPVPGLSAAGLHHPMDVKPGSSSGIQHPALLPPPTRSKRCATHCYIAQFIQHQQRVAKMNSFWPPTANRSGPFFGPRPFHMGVVPPTDAASLLVNPMQGSYPVRAHTPMQEAKAPSVAASPFQASLSKDKSLGNAAGAESSQRKQPPAHETQQSTPMPNMLQTPAFIFPFNQQQAAAVAAANAANRAGDAKSSAASNAMPPSANAHTSAANPGAAAMNLSFANLQPADAQFLAILQNGAYPFQVAAHAGGPPSYRGMPPPGGPAVPFFNGHVYSPHMMHPSQQQGAQQQSHQKTPMPTLSSSSQKHQQQSPGLLGYAPTAAATAASNSQNYSSGSQRPVLLPGLTHRQEGDKAGQDGPSSDDKPSHSQKGGYEHSFAVPVNLPNFAMMPAAQAAGIQSDKKSSDHHHHQQQQTQVSRGQGVRIDLASSQPFVMPFGSIGPPGSAPTGLDFSALAAQNHAVFHHQEAARHGYPQLNFAAAQSVQATQHKPQHQMTGETKSVAGDSSSTPSTGDSERKKSASTKYPGDSQQHSLSFTRTENKSYVAPFLGGSTNEGSSRTLSLIGTEPPNAFGMGSKSTNSSTPVSTPAAASSTISQQQQQHFLQMHPKHQQQLIQHHHLNRPRSAAPSTPNSAGGYPDRLSFQNMYPSSAAQGGVQSPQLKASSGRGAPSSAATTPSAAPPSNLIMMKNSSHHQQQAKVPMQGQALSTPGHQPQSSLTMSTTKMGPSNLSTGGDLSRSSNAPVASGSPSNSVSKSTGGSPPATGSAKIVQQPVQLQSQQQSAKNPASTSGSKSTPTNHFSMPSILGQQPNVSPGSTPGSKQQSHIQKHQPYPQGHFFISSNYGATQALGPSAAPPGLYQKRPGDKSQQQAPHQQNAMSAAASNNMKVLHPSSGGFMHLAAAAQSAGGVPHSHMSAAQLTFGVGAMPMPVKPSSDQKPAAGK